MPTLDDGKKTRNHANMGSKPVRKSAVGAAVAHNVKAIRDRRNLSQASLAALLGELGRPMQTTAIAKIESMDRRVDVDDLAALAIALNVSPIRLLLPDTGTDLDAPVELMPSVVVPAWTAWRWAAGEHQLYRKDPTSKITRNAAGRPVVEGDEELLRRELAYLDERPLWMRLGSGSELSKQLADLTRVVRQAMRHAPDVYGAVHTKAQTARWVASLPAVALAANKISRTARDLVEEIENG